MLGDGEGEGLAQAFELFFTNVPNRLTTLEEALAQAAWMPRPGPPTASGAAPPPSAPGG